MLPNSIFKGYTVLELASVLAGPATGQFFAELGARVIKVENHRAGGDVTRSWKQPGEMGKVSAYFSSVNWGKESVCIDLRETEGRKLALALASESDFVIASFKPGSAEKLGLTYDEIKNVNPSVIYGGITGYGTENGRVGYDAVIQAESGFMYLNRAQGSEPLKMPVALVDLLAAHQLKEAMLVAHIERMKSGAGCEVSISLLDAAVSSLANQGSNFLVGGVDPEPAGSAHPNIAPYGEFLRSSDNKDILLAVGSDVQFRNLCDILGVAHLASDPRFGSNVMRVRNRKALMELLNQASVNYSAETLLSAFNAAHVPAGEIRTVGQAITHASPQLRLTSDELQGIRTFTANSSDLTEPPTLGRDSVHVLIDVLKLTSAEVEVLSARGIIG